MTPDEIAARILAGIAALPFEEQGDAILALINAGIQHAPPELIREIQREVDEAFPMRECPLVQQTLDLLEGQLALREIAKMEEP